MAYPHQTIITRPFLATISVIAIFALMHLGLTCSEAGLLSRPGCIELLLRCILRARYVLG